MAYFYKINLKIIVLEQNGSSQVWLTCPIFVISNWFDNTFFIEEIYYGNFHVFEDFASVELWKI